MATERRILWEGVKEREISKTWCYELEKNDLIFVCWTCTDEVVSDGKTLVYHPEAHVKWDEIPEEPQDDSSQDGNG